MECPDPIHYLLQISGSRTEVPGPAAAAASLGAESENSWATYPRPTESEARGTKPNAVFNEAQVTETLA